MQLEDEELQEMIDAAVAGEAERSYRSSPGSG